MARRGENIYKRKDGRWEGRYICGRTPAGKAEYGYVYARSYSACREKCRKQAEALRPVPPPQHNMTMLQATEHFLGKKQDAVKKSTYNRYAYMCKRYILPELGTIQLCTLTADRLSRLFRQLRKKNLSEKSIRDVGVLIKSVLKFARKKLNCSCPACEAPLPACHSKKVEVFTEREITLLAGQIAAEPNLTGLCVLLVLNTGLSDLYTVNNRCLIRDFLQKGIVFSLEVSAVIHDGSPPEFWPVNLLPLCQSIKAADGFHDHMPRQIGSTVLIIKGPPNTAEAVFQHGTSAHSASASLSLCLFVLRIA